MGSTFRRNLLETEEDQFLALSSLLGSVFVPEVGDDRRVWKGVAIWYFQSGFFLLGFIFWSLLACLLLQCLATERQCFWLACYFG